MHKQKHKYTKKIMSKEKIELKEPATTGAALANEKETAMEMAQRLTKEVEDYKKMIDEIMTQEELDEKEKEIIAIIDENDKHLKDVKYVLPKNTEFEGKSYSKSDVGAKIIYFISKIEQSWIYVKGLYDLCNMWKQNDFNEISYGALDSTLRLLDQVKFRGMQEWRDILIINEYMKPLHEAYAKENTYQIANGQKHSAIISRRELIDPVKAAEKKDAEPTGAPVLDV